MKLTFEKLFLLLVILIISSCQKETEQPEEKPNMVFKSTVSTESNKNDPLAAKLGNLEIRESELNKGIENEIFELKTKIYEIQQKKLKAVMLEKLMDNDPKKKGLSNDEFFEKYIDKKREPKDSEVKAFIKNRGIPENSVNDKLKERIKEFIKNENKQKDVDSWLAEKTKKNPMEIYFQKPERPTYNVQAGDSPIYGDPNSKVTIIEYSDFQCPFCKKGSDVISEIKKHYKDKVKIVFKNFPLPFHIHAQKAAEASLCAFDQGGDNFWKMHDAMFGDQAKLSVEDLNKTAINLNLDGKKFADCLKSGKNEAKVLADLEEGKKVGVKSTPTFFINGKIINGAYPFETFKEIIDESIK